MTMPAPPTHAASPHGRGSLLAAPRRAVLAVLVVALIGATATWLRVERTWPRVPYVAPALGHAAAAARQQGMPTSAAEARVAIDHDLAIVRQRAAQSPNWSDQAAVGALLLARARLTKSFDDYLDAGRAFDAAFRVAAPGTGPHFDRASWNFTVHRLDAVEPDLAAIDHYAVPDTGETAAVIGLRGDVLFYRGHYAQALACYQRAQALIPTIGGDLRLANYYGRMGDPDRAMALLDQADARMSGPQQQLRAFTEVRRAALETGRGRWDAAEAHLRRADDIFPGYWLVDEPRATMRALRGAPDEAIAIFLRLWSRDHTPDAADGLAGLYRGKGDVANAQLWAGRADALWTRRLAVLPEAALGHILDHLLAFGDPARALAIAQRNYALRPYGDSATGLAWAWLANNRPAEALAAIRPTIAAGWVAAEPHIVAAEAHALLGHGPQADAERAAALAINPHALDRNPGMTWLEQ